MGMMYPTPPAYQGMQPQAHVQQRPQAGGTTWGAQGGKGEEHRKEWERIGGPCCRQMHRTQARYRRNRLTEPKPKHKSNPTHTPKPLTLDS